MLSNCPQLSRRNALACGSLAPLGLSLAGLLAGRDLVGEDRVHAKDSARTAGGRAKNCILVFMEGGPAHQDMWDLKPEAPSNVRGEFQPIPSSLPGLDVCEHLPHLARQMHRVSLVRSVHHTTVDHNAGAYYMLTGRTPVRDGKLIIREEPDNFPPFGAVLSRLRPVRGTIPSFVHLPELMSNNGYDIPGELAGFLGAGHDPLIAGDPSAPNYEIPGLALSAGTSAPRLRQRRELVRALEGAVRERDALASVSATDLTQHYARAYALLESTETRHAFDVTSEPTPLRERYGMPDRINRSVEARKFGGLPHLGQSLLLARRLVEAGVRLVTVVTGRRIDQAWDTHRQHFPLLKQSLLPYFDRAFAALLEDLSERGLLDETLVVAMGEFGRTPKLGQITSGAGAESNGRDHWPHCYTVLMAGGGIKAGNIFGASDRFAAFPKSNPVTPEDIAATIYEALGVSPETLIHDQLSRPYPVATGKVIDELFV